MVGKEGSNRSSEGQGGDASDLMFQMLVLYMRRYQELGKVNSGSFFVISMARVNTKGIRKNYVFCKDEFKRISVPQRRASDIGISSRMIHIQRKHEGTTDHELMKQAV